MPPELMGPAHDGSGAVEPDHVPAIERICNDIAARMMQTARELRRQKQIVADLLRVAGTKGICKEARCQQDIVNIWRAGTLIPFNLDGTPHGTTCVGPDLISSKGQTTCSPKR
jgi:hypothetical protein